MGLGLVSSGDSLLPAGQTVPACAQLLPASLPQIPSPHWSVSNTGFLPYWVSRHFNTSSLAMPAPERCVLSGLMLDLLDTHIQGFTHSRLSMLGPHKEENSCTSGS